MPFQPFGFPFDVDSPLTPAEVNARVRRKAKTWFEKRNGARGWVLGPFICMWWSAFAPRGPMLFGWISPSGAGSRIVGRAGSDLNGVVYVTLLIPTIIVSLLIRTTFHPGTLNPALNGIGLLLIVVIPIWLLGAWMRQSLHDEAEPLLRFLRNTATPTRRTATRAAARSLTLTVNDTSRFGAVSAADIEDALSGTGLDDILILEASPQDYIQTAWADGGFILERREGGADRHFRAETPDGSVTITVEEVLAAFVAYAEERAMPSSLIWKAHELRA